MERHICERCGSELTRQGKEYVCRYCGAHYDNVAEDLAAKALRDILDAAKIEQLSIAKRLLYETTHAKNPSTKKIQDAVFAVLKVNPDDELARFYESAMDDDPAILNEWLLSAEVSPATAEEVIRWSLLSLDARNVFALKDFCERHLDDERRLTSLSAIEDEAEKLDAGLYNPSFPRQVFLCYSSKDQEKVIEICDLLEENGFTVFAAYRNLRHGKGAAENYLEALRKAMMACKVVVFLSSKNSRSASCDALKIELPFIRDHCPKMKRIEYLLDRYEDQKKIPLLVSQLLEDAFEGLEWCKTPKDLVKRVFDATRKESIICPNCGHENPAGTRYCGKCGEPLLEEDRESRRKNKQKQEEEKAALARQKEESERKAKEAEEKLRNAQSAQAEIEAKKLAEEKARLEEERKALEREKLAAEKARLEAERKALEEEKASLKAKKAPAPSKYRVILREFGREKVPVIKVVGEITGLTLMPSKKLVDSAPVTIVEGISRAEAEAHVKSFKDAGATAVIEPIEGSVEEESPKAKKEPAEGEYRVVLRSAGNEKIPVIKTIQKITGMTLMPAKDLVDRAPVVIVEGISRIEAETHVASLRNVGAIADAESTAVPAPSKESEQTKSVLYEIVVEKAEPGFGSVAREFHKLSGEQAEYLAKSLPGPVYCTTDTEKALSVSKRFGAYASSVDVREYDSAEASERLKAFEQKIKWLRDGFLTEGTTLKRAIMTYNSGFGVTTLTEAKIPEGITIIGDGAFLNLTANLVTIPKTVVEIHPRAFESASIKTLEVAKDNAVFYSDPNRNMVIEKKTKKLVASGCLASDIPQEVKVIGESSFEGRAKLARIALPKELIAIEARAFESTALTSVEIPASVKTIGPKAFAYCKGTLKMNISEAPKGFDKDWLEGYQGKVEWKAKSVPSTKDFTYEGCILVKYNGKGPKVDIPAETKKIGSEAFRYNKGVASVSLPKSVVSIGESAFDGCVNLKEIAIPPYCGLIETSAFQNCASLRILTIPYISAQEICYSAFYGCKQLGFVDVDAHTIGSNAFESCGTLSPTGGTTFQLGDHVQEIRFRAFAFSKFSSIYIPNSVKRIGPEAFKGCTGNIYTSLEKPLGWDTGVNISDVFNKEALEGFKGQVIWGVSRPKPLTEAMYRNRLKEAQTEEKQEKKEKEKLRNAPLYYGFYPQSKVTDQKLIETLSRATDITDGEFFSYQRAIYARNGKDYFFVEPIAWRILDRDGNIAKAITDRILDCRPYQDRLSSAGGDYQRSKLRSWLKESFVRRAFPDGGQAIVSNNKDQWDWVEAPRRKLMENRDYKFASPAGRKAAPTDYAISCGVSTSLPAYWTSTSSGDFPNAGKEAYCIAAGYFRSISNLDIPEGVRVMAYIDLEKAKAAPVPQVPEAKISKTPPKPDSEFVVERGVLVAYKGNATEIVIPPSVTEIAPEVFRGKDIVSVDLGKVETIGSRAFAKCMKLLTVTGGAKGIDIWDHAFEECRFLKSFPKKTAKGLIGDGAFSTCNSLTSIELCASSVGWNAFELCTSLQEVKLEGEFDTLRDGTFLGCTSLKKVTIPETVKFIMDKVFYKCENLKSIVFWSKINNELGMSMEDALKSIGAYAFSGCSSLSFTVSPTVEKISFNAFEGMKGPLEIQVKKPLFGYPAGFDKKFLEGYAGEVKWRKKK